jgi:hypothetical protein
MYAGSIDNIRANRPSNPQVSPMGFTMVFWSLVSDLVNEAVAHPYQCEELFWLCKHLFSKLVETNPDLLEPQELMIRWGTLLLSQPNKHVSQSYARPVCGQIFISSRILVILKAWTLLFMVSLTWPTLRQRLRDQPIA